jgi:RNA polymerase sigma factor (sigma-70 family)
VNEEANHGEMVESSMRPPDREPQERSRSVRPDPSPRTVGSTLFADLLQRNAGRIARMARALRNRRPRAADADTLDDVQDASARFLEKPRRIRSETHFLALFRGFIRNAFLDRARRDGAARRGGDAREADLSPSELGTPASSLGPLTRAELQDRREQLKDALQRLDRRERRLVYLRVWEDRSWDEIARELDLASPDAARMHYNRTLARVREILPTDGMTR